MSNRFDKNGFLLIPDPRVNVKDKKKIIDVAVIEHCFCPKGHDIIWENANFNGYSGIRIYTENSVGKKGDIVLSPIFGDHTRISLGLKLIKGEKVKLMCPVCHIEFPILKPCECGNGNLHIISLKSKFSYSSAIAVRDVVDCYNSYIINADELINESLRGTGK